MLYIRKVNSKGPGSLGSVYSINLSCAWFGIVAQMLSHDGVRRGSKCWSAEVLRVTGVSVGVGGGSGARRDSLEFGGGGPAAALQEYTRKWGPSPLSPPLGAALGPVGLRPVSAAPGAETAKYRCRHWPPSSTTPLLAASPHTIRPYCSFKLKSPYHQCDVNFNSLNDTICGHEGYYFIWDACVRCCILKLIFVHCK